MSVCKKSRKRYGLEPLLPGVFEVYFMARQDTPENLQKAAELFRYIFKHFDEVGYSEKEPKIFRPILPLESKEKLIKIDESFDASQQVLSYEQVEDLINQNEFFALIPCQCRLIGEMTGEPCKVAPKEMGCIAAGRSAQGVELFGWGKTMTKEETIEYLKKAEKKGLVHMTSNTKGGEHLMYICNCCSCHCGVLMPTKNYKMKMISPSNFKPTFDGELCTNCKLCIKKCPMEAITSPEEKVMVIQSNDCIGCGVCAFNCSSGAMKLEKVTETDLPEWHKIGRKIFMKTMGDLMKS
ncbi:MAG: 4Fe-4S dicluster domain-containing protein [Candidatus Hodarchaeota archaeon]